MPKVMTQEEFLVKATLKHGQYNYSQAKYSGWDSILTIICPLHGSFEQRAFKHLSGHGCSECGKDKIKKVLSKSQDKFIEECNIVHNNKYNYSKVFYTKSKNKIIIICPIHGEFSQIADDHSSGHGCSQCSIDKQALGKTMNFDQFIEKANRVHNNKYTYYSKNFSAGLLIINCPIHGDFQQKRGVHLLGHGCQSCAGCKILTVAEVIDRGNKIHNNFYDYTNSIIDDNKKININCPKHGSFCQNINDHIAGHGCLQCGIENNAEIRRFTTQQFIEKANLVHNDLYDYSQTQYAGIYAKVIIICKIHGSFEQRAGNHLNDHGCPSCSHFVSKPEIEWLNSLGITVRQHTIMIGKKRYQVDGFDPATNTAYEFNGDYWHGNPAIYDPNDINRTNYKTFGELYQNTLEKEKALISAGYKVVSIWQSDFGRISI